MAKRGETRPWQIRFVWNESDIKGTETFINQDAALFSLREILRASHSRGRSVSLTISDRTSGKSWEASHNPEDCNLGHE